jgi:hypothetical protein
MSSLQCTGFCANSGLKLVLSNGMQEKFPVTSFLKFPEMFVVAMTTGANAGFPLDVYGRGAIFKSILFLLKLDVIQSTVWPL